MERVLARNQWFSYRKTDDSGFRNSLHEVKRSDNPKRWRNTELPKRNGIFMKESKITPSTGRTPSTLMQKVLHNSFQPFWLPFFSKKCNVLCKKPGKRKNHFSSEGLWRPWEVDPWRFFIFQKIFISLTQTNGFPPPWKSGGQKVTDLWSTIRLRKRNWYFLENKKPSRIYLPRPPKCLRWKVIFAFARFFA